MKNYYAILEVPVGCGVADIRQAYRRLVQENLDNDAVFADLKEAHEVLTTPARRADYDRAVWGETFAPDGGEGFAPSGADAATLLPGAALPAVLDPLAGARRCPMGAEAQCPVLLARVEGAETYCPECGYLLSALSAGGGFESAGPAEADRDIRLEEPDGRSHRLRPGLNLVGRESADVLLPDKTVSRQHARLEVGEDGTVTLEDLSSTNGTQIGGDRLVPHVPRSLQPGDRIRFGSVLTELRLPPEPLNKEVNKEAPPAREAGSDSTEQGPPAVGARTYSTRPAVPMPAGIGNARAHVVETREEGGRAYPLVPGVTTFGRRAENSVVIQGDPYVSGSHAQIIADGDVFRLTDIGSTNGTLLNGRRLAINEPVTLSPDDVVLIGGTAMRFELLHAAEEAVPEEAVPEEAGPQEAVPEEAPAVKAAETDPEDVPAEPRERTASEYDVPEGAVTGNTVTGNTVTEDDDAAERAPAQESPTHAER